MIRSYALSMMLFMTPSILPGAQAPAAERTPVVLVELFTSEGCSSCPPADELLRQIHGKQTPYGQRVIGLSEHVTYWNRLGWKDPYSAQIFTDRQEIYGARFKLDSVYTPQMVINGQEQLVGSDVAALSRVLQNQAGKPQVDLHIVSAERMGDGISVHFSAQKLPKDHPVDIMAVVADDLDESRVLRGENGGRTLQHVSVARTIMRLATIAGDTDRTVHLAVPPDSISGNAKGRQLILFAQAPAYGPVSGADSKPLH